MLLACDIGNTNIKTGLFNNASLTAFNIFPDINKFFEHLKTLPEIDLAISSVVPGTTQKVSNFLQEHKNQKPFLITKDVKFNLKIDYESFDTLGIDRLCSAEGAFVLFKNSDEHIQYNKNTIIITIDLGTATTINLIKYPGVFSGGIIAPGIAAMFKSLNKNTAQLPELDHSFYNGVIGKNTTSSIASGVINSAIGLVEKTLSYFKSENEESVIRIYLTGGNAKFLIPSLKFNYVYKEDLVVRGIKAVYELNKLYNLKD
jgi:type III pantothenate kinase